MHLLLCFCQPVTKFPTKRERPVPLTTRRGPREFRFTGFQQVTRERERERERERQTETDWDRQKDREAFEIEGDTRSKSALLLQARGGFTFIHRDLYLQRALPHTYFLQDDSEYIYYPSICSHARICRTPVLLMLEKPKLSPVNMVILAVQSSQWSAKISKIDLTRFKKETSIN